MPSPGDLSQPARTPEERNALILDNMPLPYGALKQPWAARPLRQLGREEAESVALAAFFRCCELWDPARGASLSSYVYVAVRHALWSAAERAMVEAERLTLTGGLGSWEPPAPESRVAMDEDDLRRALARVRNRLPNRLRVVIARRFFDGWTLQKVADLLGVTKERARQLQRLALRRLRELMAGTKMATLVTGQE